MKNSDNSNILESESEEKILDADEKVSTKLMEDDAEMKSNGNCKKFGSNWTARLSELVIYKRTHGHCNVPHTYEANKSLANWVHNQRTAYRNGKLSEERIRMLNAIRFVWDQRGPAVWRAHYDELVAYKDQHGDCNVPHTYEANKSLGIWVHNQRIAFRNGKLSEDRIRMLNDIGFVWEQYGRDTWRAHYDELVAYKDQHGDCNVSRSDETNKSLVNWVATQRTAYKNGKLSEDRIRMLNDIGFVWKQYERATWRAHYDELVAYKDQNGDCNVSQSDETNKSLVNWVYTQRYAYRDGKLSEDRVRMLNAIGFVWKQSGHVTWRAHYDELVTYKDQHGDCNVSQSDETNKSLGIWVKNQRTAYRNGKLSEERVRLLNDIGFVSKS